MALFIFLSSDSCFCPRCLMNSESSNCFNLLFKKTNTKPIRKVFLLMILHTVWNAALEFYHYSPCYVFLLLCYLNSSEWRGKSLNYLVEKELVCLYLVCVCQTQAIGPIHPQLTPWPIFMQLALTLFSQSELNEVARVQNEITQSSSALSRKNRAHRI